MDKEVVNIERCIDEYLAFQHVESNMSWKTGYHNRPYLKSKEFARVKLVSNGDEAVNALCDITNKAVKNFNTDEIGILLSSGIDSACIAKMMPKGSHAFYATYKERDVDPEIDLVRKTCEINQLKLHVIEASWKDYMKYMDFLMTVKKNPIHPCEVPVYKCCLKAREMGIKLIFSGWGADIHFGGMDKLLSKDWNFKDFKKRYEYCPRRNNENEGLDKTYDLFLTPEKMIDTQKFLSHNYHNMQLKCFFYLPEITGLVHLPLWEYIGPKDRIDIKKVRSGNSKYIIRETFEILYKNDNRQAIEKISFTRPTDIYMKEHLNDIPYDNFGLDEYLKKNKLTSQQLWMVYCLNRFLRNVLRI